MSPFYWHRTPGIIKKIFPGLLWSLPENGKTIYLTFDDGPVPEITGFILEELKVYNAKATFFCVGDNVNKFPSLFHRILSHHHAVGNHTYNHLNGWKTQAREYLLNVNLCEKEFASHGYNRISKLFRPPQGLLRISQLRKLKASYNIIMWDVLSGDFDPELSKEACLKNTISAVRNGSIIVFHDNIKSEKKLRYVLPRFLKHFAEKGFQFANL